MRRLVSLVAILLLPTLAHAAAIDHAYVEVTTVQTTTNTAAWDDVPGAELADGWAGASLSSGTGFTDGEKYLIQVCAQVTENDAGFARLQVLHGSTAFEDGVAPITTGHWSQGGGEWMPYCFQTLWTAVASEGIKLQMRTTAGTTSVDQISLLAVCLSCSLTENTDFYFAERTTDDALTTTAADGASVTFTPSGSSTWLVLTYDYVDISSATVSFTGTLDSSGDVTSTTPSWILNKGSTSELIPVWTARCYALTAQSNTFKTTMASVGSNAHTRLYSNIIALNMSKFRNSACAYTEADVALGSVTHATNIQTTTIDPSVTSNVWVGGYWGADVSNSARKVEFRLTADGSDVPDTQSTDDYDFRHGGADSADENPFGTAGMIALTTGSKTLNLDANEVTDDGPTAQHRLIWALTMELTAANRRGFIGSGRLGF